MRKLLLILVGISLAGCGPSSTGHSASWEALNLSPGMKAALVQYQAGPALGVSFTPGDSAGLHRTLWEHFAKTIVLPWKETAQGEVSVGSFVDDDPQGLPVPLFPVDTPQGKRTAYWRVASSHPDLWRLANTWVIQSRQSGAFEEIYTSESGRDWEGAAAGDLVPLVPGDETLEWLKPRWTSGQPLKAAMRPQQFSYLPGEKGDSRGFDYNLLRALSRSLGLRILILEKSQISDFFTHNGVMPADVSTNTDYTFTPDLLSQVDVYPGSWGITPWRERLMTMVPLYPGRNQLASRPGRSVTQPRDLNGHTFAVVRDSFQHKQLQQLEADEGITLKYVYGYEENDLFALLHSGKADHVLEGSLFFAKYLDVVKTMEVKPFGTDLWTVGWGIKKEDTGLKSLLQNFFDQAQADGIFGRYWKITFGAEFQDYMAIVLATGN